MRTPPPVVMITGASAGVGRAVARAYGVTGARVGLLARGRAGLEGARRDVVQGGGDALVLPADVAREDDVEAAAARLEQAFGPIDVWINNAMVTVFSPVAETTAAEFARVTEVTYLGVVHGTQAALRRMRPRNAGSIVQVGSTLAYRGIPLQAAYCAAKHAVEGFMDSLRVELVHEGSRIRLSMVQLPALNTPQFDWVKSRLPRRAQPVPPLYQPEVAARAILWAAAHGPRRLLVGGPTVAVVAGNALAPGLADRYLARHEVDAQQTDEPDDPDRPHNLWAPVDDDRDHGAHGRFGEAAASRSWSSWVARHRPAAAALALTAGAAVVAAAAGRARTS